MKRQREELVAQRMEDLRREFTAYLEYFEKSERFTGPSIYFHLKTVDRFKELGSSALRAAKDERFCELLYSTLVAWGMHAMVTGAKMPDFEPFADSISSLAPEIDELSHYEITTLSSKDTLYITDKLWSLIARLRGSTKKSKLVANSKILHHLLPHLVPPIDRNNEAVFFELKNKFQGNEERVFESIFPGMVSIAKGIKGTLDIFAYQGFNSSETKVVDNAIIGYVLKEDLRSKRKQKE